MKAVRGVLAAVVTVGLMGASVPAQAAKAKVSTQVQLVSSGQVSVQVNDTSLAKGQVKSRQARRALSLQRLTSSNEWATVKTVKSGPRGKFQTRIAHDAVGTFKYRWRVWATRTAKGASSKIFTYSVKSKPVVPPEDSSPFSFVVIGDTQSEVLSANGTARFRSRTQWIADNEEKEDIRFVASTGDFTNWGWLDQAQYDRAKSAMGELTQAQIPYAVSEGNHDTRAVGWNGVQGSRAYGGAAYVGNPECVERLSPAECKTQLLVRKSNEFNANLKPSDFANLRGQFEAGKVENSYSTFSAGTTKWMMLNLELWPRAEVVTWAKNVVASHADYNVVIQTHSYLEGDGSVSSSNGGYGATSPSYLYDNLVSKYSNVKMVFSGHTGSLAARTDEPNGNKVLSFLGNEASGAAATRIVTVDPANGTVATRAYIGNNVDYSGTPTNSTFESGLRFVQ